MTDLHVDFHPERKGGKRPPHAEEDKPRLKLNRYLINGTDAFRTLIDYPVSVDDIGVAGLHFDMDGNDYFGTCVPTSFDNLRRLITRLLTGNMTTADWDQIKTWYRTQNPGFDESSDADDNGMVIQDFLAYLVKQGTILGFAQVDHTNEAEVRAANYVFLSLILGINVTANQVQEAADGATWIYNPNDRYAGGHAVMQGAYEDSTDDIITWTMRVLLSKTFRDNQVDEAWVVILPEHIDHPNFRENIDLRTFAADYKALTGRDFPVDVGPLPEPTPEPAPEPEPQSTLTMSFTTDDEELATHIHNAVKRGKYLDPNAWLAHVVKTHFK